jgi:hypothetical protein
MISMDVVEVVTNLLILIGIHHRVGILIPGSKEVGFSVSTASQIAVLHPSHIDHKMIIWITTWAWKAEHSMDRVVDTAGDQ